MSNTTTVAAPHMIRIPHQVRFWCFLVSNVISLSFTLITLYFLLSDRTLRRALHNHIIIVLLVIGLIYELTVIPWFIHNDRFDTPWSTSSKFYLFWVFFDYFFYALQIELFAWATIERHILIFHDQWLSTARRRFLIHYLPVLVIIRFYVVNYCLVYFDTPCSTSFDGFLAGGIYIPCAFDRTFMATWDLMFHQVVPTLMITFCSVGRVVRVVYHKTRIRQPVQWRKHRKMTIQLCTISIIYIVFGYPWVWSIFAYQCGLPSEVAIYGFIYGKFLYYYIIFSFPLVSFLSLSELRKKFVGKFVQRRRNNRVTVTKLATFRKSVPAPGGRLSQPRK